MLLARLMGLLLAIPFHEVSHAFVSEKLGDPTARQLGRMTLNPAKHLDVMGLVSMLVIGVGWAKPVPVDPRHYKNPKTGMAISAAAGPLSNLVLALASLVVYKLVLYGGLLAFGGVPPVWVDTIVLTLLYFVIINISLALFNLLPIPPLDGSRIFGILLPNRLYFAIQRYERYVMIALFAAIFLLPRLFNINLFGWLFEGVGGVVLDGMNWLTGFIDRLFLNLLT